MLCWSPETYQQSGKKSSPPPLTVEAWVVDVWRDGWFRVPEEGKSAEIWMDDDRRDAKMDEHERVEGDKRACVCVCACV